MDELTNPDGTADGSNPDGSEVASDEQPAETSAPQNETTETLAAQQSLEDYLAAAPEHLREEVDGAALRHKAFTQKSQGVADLRRQLEAEYQAKLAAIGQPTQVQPDAPAAAAKEWTPEEIKADPVGFMDARVEARAASLVDARLEQLGLTQAAPALKSLQFESDIRGAYQSWLSQDPGRAAMTGLGESVGTIIANDPSLRDLANTNPQAAVAAAGSIAPAQREAQAAAQRLDAMKKKAVERAAAAPLSTQTGAPAAPNNKMTDREAAAAALREAGLWNG